MRKSILLVLAGLAGGIVIGKTVTSEMVNDINPFREAVYDCSYRYFLPNQMPQKRSFVATENELSVLKANSNIDTLVVRDIIKSNEKYLLIADVIYGSTFVTCERRK